MRTGAEYDESKIFDMNDHHPLVHQKRIGLPVAPRRPAEVVRPTLLKCRHAGISPL
jgi:hypothetical protein